MQITSALFVDEIRKHDDGRVDLLGLFEDIYFEQVPVTLESLSLFVDMEITSADAGRPHVLELRLSAPSGELVQPPTKVRFAIPPEDALSRPTAQLDLSLFQLTFRQYGPHFLEILADDVPARRLYLGIQPRDD